MKQQLIKYPRKKIKEIQFSIDGFDEETNSLIRGKGAFTNCMNNVDHLCKLGKRVSIAITPPYNILKNSQTKYIDFVKQLLSKYHNSVKIFFTQSLMSGRYLKEKDLDVFHNEYKEIIKQIVREINPNFEKESFVSKVKDSLNSVCGYGNLVVLSNGDYYFCDNIPKSKLIGNIRNKTFYQIFNEMNEAEKNCNIDNFKWCSSCELRYICGGGCRIINFPSTDVTKDFDHNKQRHCSKEKKQELYKLMIMSNEEFYS